MIVGTLGEPGQGRPQPGEVGNWSGFVALLKSGAMTTAPEFAENATMNQRLSSLLSSLGEVTVMLCLAAVALMSAKPSQYLFEIMCVFCGSCCTRLFKVDEYMYADECSNFVPP